MRILIIAMKTWGELGNYLAAKSLARTIHDVMPDVHIRIEESEKYVPVFSAFGREIKEIHFNDFSSRKIKQAYMGIMAKIERIFPPQFELMDTFDGTIREYFNKLLEDISLFKPDIIIGTKGIISRICSAVVRSNGLNISVVNFITNHGLLQLPIHQSNHVDVHIVQFREGMDYLLNELKYDKDKCKLVQPLVVSHGLKYLHYETALKNTESVSEKKEADQTFELKVVIFSNRGSDKYLKIIRHIVENVDSCNCIFICYNDKQLAEKASAFLPAAGGTKLQIYHKLEQREYFSLINGISHAKTVLISKAGPNTVLEAVFLNMPVLVTKSGLPMEDWVFEMVKQNGIGMTADTIDETIKNIDRCIADPEMINGFKNNIDIYRRSITGESATDLRSVLTEVHSNRRYYEHFHKAY